MTETKLTAEPDFTRSDPYTYADYEALPDDGKRWELINGLGEAGA